MINDFLDKSIATVLIPENDNIEQFSKITYLEVKKKLIFLGSWKMYQSKISINVGVYKFFVKL